ncbi:MAG: hypothetical protein ACYCZP_07555 [Acidimicrobiales bacterium]
MVVVNHEMGFVRQVADRVVMTDEGVVVGEGPPQKTFDSADHDRTRGFPAKPR